MGNTRTQGGRRGKTVDEPLTINAWLAWPDLPPTAAVDDAVYPDADALLVEVVDQYLNSREFNGLPVGRSSGPHAKVEKFVREGLVQVVTSTDYLNTHIRPWLGALRSALTFSAVTVSRWSAGAVVKKAWNRQTSNNVACPYDLLLWVQVREQVADDRTLAISHPAPTGSCATPSNSTKQHDHPPQTAAR